MCMYIGLRVVKMTPVKWCFLLVCIGLVESNWKDILPWNTKSTILDLHQDFDIQTINDNPVPIYRKDLNENYAAYWLIEYNDGEFMILSSGPETGDYRLVMKGEYSPLVDLNEFVRRKDSTCKKYYMMSPTPGFLLGCEDEKGNLFCQEKEVITQLDKLKVIWAEQRKDVKKAGVWTLSSLYTDDGATHYHLLKPGHTKHIMIGDYDSGDIETQASKNYNSQKYVCDILDVCLADNINRIDRQKVKVTKYGQRHIELIVPHETPAFSGEDVIYMDISTRTGSSIQTTKVAIDLVKRVKRSVPGNQSYSIDDEDLFPDYDQHKIQTCRKMIFFKYCRKRFVGCGPVSWAMILGYYDRRSHNDPYKYGNGSQNLFTCGSTGMGGNSSCVAPGLETNETKKYVEKLGEFLGTFWLFGQGATTARGMKKIETFFTEYQLSGKQEVITHSNGFWSLIGNYNDEIRDKAMEYIREGWPVVIGMRIKGSRFGQHYPVATKYQQRAFPSLKCKKLFNDCEEGLLVEREFYVHWGWGYNSRNWIPAKVFFAGIAKY
ncbi:hypothetical protein LOTGIDRAFT_230987 [Lottia gigantea]|uniref:Uncharacterized protein n=1 Tax=Lottia gigantea TaxID=225164 RepID=V4B184_LOTGI|nr:hypothetical protein LOTGIDRAFT_230987 [Lottia gigantea]ESP00047.1 hypothetical protein LOTGIDRAFT_230987 [Lottia gigantea]